MLNSIDHHHNYLNGHNYSHVLVESPTERFWPRFFMNMLARLDVQLWQEIRIFFLQGTDDNLLTLVKDCTVGSLTPTMDQYWQISPPIINIPMMDDKHMAEPSGMRNTKVTVYSWVNILIQTRQLKVNRADVNLSLGHGKVTH